MTNLFQAAKFYQSLGWFLIPIRTDGSKSPAIKEWTPYKIKQATEEELTLWFEKKQFNIGVICGQSGFAVIDDDSYKSAGGQIKLASTLEQRTPNGGTHYLYKCPPGLRPSVNPTLAIDVRGFDSYILVAPSTVGGKTYKWNVTSLEDFREKFASLPALPLTYLEKIQPKKNTASSHNLASSFGVADNGRHIALKSDIVALANKHDKATAWKFTEVINSSYKPPLDSDDLKRTFENSYNWAKQNPPIPKVPPVEQVLPVCTDLLEKLEFESQTPRTKFNSKTLESLDKSIDGFRSGALYVFGGLMKSGKSSLLMNILEGFMQQGIKIGYLNTELLFTQFCERFTAISKNIPVKTVESSPVLRREWLASRKSVLFYEDKTKVLNAGSFSKKLLTDILQDWVRRGVKIITIDNLSSFSTELVPGKAGWEILSALLMQLIDFAKDNKIIIFPVIHTKAATVWTESPQGVRHLLETEKLEDIFKKSITTNRRPTTADLYGGNVLGQVSGGVLLMWRPFQDFNDINYRKMSMLILENFRDGSILSEIGMNFEMEKLKFEEVFSVDINFPKVLPDKRRAPF